MSQKCQIWHICLQAFRIFSIKIRFFLHSSILDSMKNYSWYLFRNILGWYYNGLRLIQNGYSCWPRQNSVLNHFYFRRLLLFLFTLPPQLDHNFLRPFTQGRRHELEGGEVNTLEGGGRVMTYSKNTKRGKQLGYMTPQILWWCLPWHYLTIISDIWVCDTCLRAGTAPAPP